MRSCILGRNFLFVTLSYFLLFLYTAQRSEEFPYTHPFGEIRSFTIAVIDGVTFVITAGGEGLIRTWRFDASKGGFEQIMVLEGHIRAVTTVLLNGKYCLCVLAFCVSCSKIEHTHFRCFPAFFAFPLCTLFSLPLVHIYFFIRRVAVVRLG